MVTAFAGGIVFGFVAAWFVAAVALMWLVAHDPREFAPWEADGTVPVTGAGGETDGEG